MNLAKRQHRERLYGGTPETIAKARPDPLKDLFDKRLIGPNEQDAAEEIRIVYDALMRGRSDELGGSGKPSDPLSRLSPREERIWREHYRPWSAAMARLLVPSTRWMRVSQLDLTIDLVWEGLTPMEIAIGSGVGPNAVALLVADSLREYARIAR